MDSFSRAGRPVQGFIYFVACVPLEAVKIGFTRHDPVKRVKGLQGACPAPLRLVTYVPGTMQEEKMLHEAFAALHIHGEWFRPELRLVDFVWYLVEGSDEDDPRERFEGAINDVLVSGYGHPDEPPEYTKAYEQSGVWK